MTSGIRLRPAEMVLIARARDYLAAGPSDAVDLIAHVCQLPGPPRSVAVHMAMALLAPFEEFSHEGDGTWRLIGDAVVDLAAPNGAPADIPAEVLRRRAASKRGSPDDRLADLSYVVVDVETTGGRSFGAD